MTQRDATADSEFGAAAAPDWNIATHAIGSSESTVSNDDPFATAAQSAAALPAIASVDEFAFASAASFEASSASASASVAASSSSVLVPAVPLADSAEYIAALEKRLARLHTRPAKKEFAHRPAGAEFLSAAGGSDAAAAGSWLDLPDSAPAAAAASSASSSAAAMAHSSEDEAEDDDAADRRRLSSAMLHAAVEERVALLTQHSQLMDDTDMRQLSEARRFEANETAAIDSAMRAAGAENPSTTAAASSTVSSSASSSSAPSTAVVADPAAASLPAYRIESSDGDDTGAPDHVHMTTVTGANESAALQSGALPLRALYYSSSACLARAAGWWEEKQEKCVIT